MAEEAAPEAQATKTDQGHESYWRANLRVMAALLAVWFVVPFGLGILFVEPLNQIHLAGLLLRRSGSQCPAFSFALEEGRYG